METIGDARKESLTAARSLLVNGDEPPKKARGFGFWCIVLTDEIPNDTPISKLINAMKIMGGVYKCKDDNYKLYRNKFFNALKNHSSEMKKHKENPIAVDDDAVRKAISKYSSNEDLKAVRRSLGLLPNNTEADESVKDEIITNPSENKGNTVKHPLNQILYGPPGTGKTYRTIDLAVEITGMAEDTHEDNHLIFRELLGDQIEFVTFHQSYAYEDFIQGLRPDVENAAGSLSFTWKDGVFKRIADRAKENYEAHTEDNEEELKNYVLIIDEINRANISRVFGELITLIEDDKRIGGSNELEVILPSEDLFSVPPNLYIIGTMNTADKSIALVDIALRRRFVFKRIYPEPELITNQNHRQILERLNRSIVELKGPDFQIGHAYFMAPEDGKVDLANVMNNKIIPLLYEYFMNDGEPVNQVLAAAEIKTRNVMGLYEYDPH